MKNKKVKIKSHKGAYLLTILFISVFLAELFIYAWCRVQCVQTGYAISSEKDENKRLLALRENLSIEFERLKSPNRIAKIARQQIGLIIPKPEQVIIVP
ncbi:MAG: cell division protein FtsL [Proteobacteria bacterium]|nr:cell division protein FtsL [Pseudomonadota bacterium]